MNGGPANRRVSRDEGVPESFRESCASSEATEVGRANKVLAFLRWASGVALLVGLGGGLAFLLDRYAHTSPRFALKEVLVVGSEHRTREEIVKTSGLPLEANLFSLDVEKARAALLADPWIEEVQWLRRLPGTVELRIKERRAALLVALPELYLATAEGIPFKRFEPGDPSDFPVLTGLVADIQTGDAALVKKRIQAALELVSDYERDPVHSLLPLQEIRAGSDGRATLVIGKSGLEVHLGEKPYRRKIEEVRRVAYELQKRGGEAKSIFVDNEGRPERVVVRLR